MRYAGLMAKRVEWAKRVERWRASGLSGGAFALREGIREGTLRHWAWRLARERSEPGVTHGFVELVGSDDLDDRKVIRRVLALVDVVYSNSMIEAWWRTLKHQWLFLNTLDTIGAVEKHVAFYVHEHNAVIPHSALGGLTPDEAYFGRELTCEPAWLRRGFKPSRIDSRRIVA